MVAKTTACNAGQDGGEIQQAIPAVPTQDPLAATTEACVQVYPGHPAPTGDLWPQPELLERAFSPEGGAKLNLLSKQSIKNLVW